MNGACACCIGEGKRSAEIDQGRILHLRKNAREPPLRVRLQPLQNVMHDQPARLADEDIGEGQRHLLVLVQDALPSASLVEASGKVRETHGAKRLDHLGI